MTDIGPDLSSVALYARYSSPMQSPKSIPDQLRECHRLIANFGGQVAAEYADAEHTGKIAAFRSGLQTLLEDCRRGRFTAICAESLDRISRNRTHLSQIYDELEYYGIPILTIQDGGRVDDVHLGLKAIMNAIWMKDLADKTRRGQKGAINAGRQIGRPAYGYRLANRIDEGQIVRGIREIDPETAPIVQRIFDLYADGMSGRALARLLNEEGIPPPRRAKQWTYNVLIGFNARSTILSNWIYKGVLVYGAYERVLNPVTGKVKFRPVPQGKWETQDVPELRLVDDATWDAAQEHMLATSRPRKHFHKQELLNKGRHPLTPLLRCPLCKGPVRTIAPDRWACQVSRSGGNCSASTFILRDVDRLSAQRLTAWVQRRKHWAPIVQQARDQAAHARLRIDAALAERRPQVQRLVAAITGGTDTREMRRELVRLENEVAELETRLDRLLAPPPVQANTEEIGPILLQHARRLQSEIETGIPEVRLPATEKLAGLLAHIDMSAGPTPGNARLRIRPDIIALIRCATESGAAA